MKKGSTLTARREKVRYAVVGLGHFAQNSILPAFKNAGRDAELIALVSGDKEKLRKLSRKYRVPHVYGYESYDELLNSGLVEAVYIALPNNLHAEYSIRAARAGIHVLCEKPMAVTEQECRDMIQACEENHVRLMVAYRLHFEEGNLQAVELANSGKLGDVRLFHSIFSMQVREGNIRLQRELGGGTIYDIGVYCINAARYLFRDEPEEVFAWSANSGDERFREVDEMTSAVMRFPGQRLATFTSSFGTAEASTFHVVGSQGDLRLDGAYNLGDKKRTQQVTIKGRRRSKTFGKRDQVAAELVYFSRCVRSGEDPEPSGWEGLADVRVVRALYESADTGQPVRLEPFEKHERPDLTQEIKRTRWTSAKEMVEVEPPKQK